MQLTKRRLSDLWIVGRELTLDDGQGDPVTVWIQKMNAAEAADTGRLCDAARAKVLAARRDTESPDWQAAHSSVLEYGNQDFNLVIEFLLTHERVKFLRRHEAEQANDEAWSKDNYLQGLRDAWADGLERRWLEDKEDAEALKVHDELERFTHEVNDLVDSDITALREGWSMRSRDELEEMMIDKLMEMDANQAWVTELHYCQVVFGTREVENHKQRYFSGRDEVNQLSAETFNRLRQAYESLEVDVAEGKGSPAPTDSSPSSEEPAAAETASTSGLVGASR